MSRLYVGAFVWMRPLRLTRYKPYRGKRGEIAAIRGSTVTVNFPYTNADGYVRIRKVRVKANQLLLENER